MLLAARQDISRPIQERLQQREHLQHTRHIPLAGPLAVGADLQVLTHVQAGKELPAFGHHRYSFAHPPMCADGQQIGSAEADFTGPCAHKSRHRAQQRRLARAVRADDSHCLTLVDREIDIEERLEVAITSSETRYVQQAHSGSTPMYTSCTWGLFITVRGSPSAIFWPNDIAMMRSTTASRA